MEKRVYLNEYNILLDNTAYLPYATGLLQAYAQTRPDINEHFSFMPIIYARDNPAKILSFYDDPAVAAFSLSIWNEQLCFSVAKSIKEKFPHCLTVFGGPSAPFDASEYFITYPFIDVVVRGEGEEVFAAVLERFLESRDFQNIPRVSYRHPGTGECVNNISGEFSAEGGDLDVFPSPYLQGFFEPFMKTDFKWQAILETNRGCPFLCTYCFWGQSGLSRKVRYFALERIRKEIEWCARNKIEYVFCADGNFGMFERDLEICGFLAQAKQKYGFPEKFRVNYTKDTDERVVKIGAILHEHRLEKAITMSLQSFNQEALSNVRRKNIGILAFKKLQRDFKDKGLATYTELILGLPGETYESWVQGLQICLENSINNDIFVYLLQIYPNTELANSEYRKKFKISSVRIPLNEGHGAIRSQDIPFEYESVVVGTYSLPVADWKRAAVISWLTQSFIGLKLGYFLILYLVDRLKTSYVDLIDYISNQRIKSNSAIIIKNNVAQLYELASAIVAGKPRTMVIEEFGNIYWEPEEVFYLNISNNKEKFYGELEEVVKEFLDSNGIKYEAEEIEEIIEYQKARTPQYAPLKFKDTVFKYNVAEYFESYFSALRPGLKRAANTVSLCEAKDYRGDKKSFVRDIILRGRKSNKMLYDVKWEEFNKGKVSFGR